jgi:hypothetical protein
MIDFKVCYPDANNFDKVIKLKPLKEWNTEYVSLTDTIGYWVAEHPFQDDGFEIFKNLIAAFPIQKDNNHPSNFDPNPFDTIHVPEWVSKDLCFLIRDFYHKHVTKETYDPQIHEWGNVYFKEKSKPISCWRIPHIDYVHGLVANLWFTDHNNSESGTKLYHYTGKMYNELYDFQLDTNHKMHNEWKSLSENPTRAPAWFNIPDAELARWGFVHVGTAPNKAGTMTMYKANVCHLAYITDSVNFRWSHAFAYSHELPPKTMRDIFR